MFWRRRNRELENELASHLEHEADRLIASGLPPGEAHRVAKRALGSTVLAHEATRREWGFGRVEAFCSDVLYGLRIARRDLGVTVAAILTLALGAGANIAVFAVVQAVLLRPLPFTSPDRLVEVHQFHSRMPAGYTTGTSAGDLEDFRASGGAFSGFAAFDWRPRILAAGSTAQVYSLVVTPNFFRLLGAEPMLGRTLSAEDFASGRDVAVVSHRFWTNRLGAEPTVIGRKIELDAHPVEVVGVMPPGFEYPPYASQVPGLRAELWEPHLQFERSRAAGDRTERSAIALGRLAPGAPVSAAQAQLDAVVARIGEQHPASNAGWKASLRQVGEEVSRDARPALAMLVCAMAMVLLLACVNVSAILLTRATARTREYEVRLALGANRARLLMQSAAENVGLSVAALVAGLLAAHWLLRPMIQLFPGNQIARLDEAAVDWTVVFMAASLMTMVTVVVAIAPAFAAGTRARTLLRVADALAVLQIALSVVLLYGAGLVLRSLQELQAVDLGFQPNPVLAARIMPPRFKYKSWDEIRQLHEAVLDSARALPGVTDAALVMTLPLSGRSVRFAVATRNGTEREAERNVITPGYFRAMGIRLQVGRVLSSDSRGAPPVVVVNQRLARDLWPGQDAIGQTLFVDNAWRTVVDVAEDERHWAVGLPPEAKLYVPYDQAGQGYQSLMGILTFLVARTDQNPASLVALTRAAIGGIDSTVPVDRIAPMRQLVSDSIALPILNAILLGTLGAIALAVAGVGIFGMMSYSVVRRTQEIGLRLAVGSPRSRVVASVLARALRLTALGSLPGVLLALAFGRLLRNQLFGVHPVDPRAMAGALGVLAFTALFSVALPSWRASRIEPIRALRHQA